MVDLATSGGAISTVSVGVRVVDIDGDDLGTVDDLPGDTVHLGVPGEQLVG